MVMAMRFKKNGKNCECWSFRGIIKNKIKENDVPLIIQHASVLQVEFPGFVYLDK